MKKDLVLNKFSSWKSKAAGAKLPRFNELPEIDLYMDQVIALMEKYLICFSADDEKTKLVTPAIINNYVKLEILPAPIKKKYSKNHLAQLIMICLLKQAVSISHISSMLKVKLESSNINEVYDSFCEQYERSFKTQMALTDINSCDDIERSICDLSLYMAINASASNYISQCTVGIINEDISQKSAKQKDIQNEKQKQKPKKADDKKQ